MASPPICVRIGARTRALIERRRGSRTLSAWVRDALTEAIEREQEVPADLAAEIREHNKQLRGLGINLNQLAHNANEGRPVVVNDRLLTDIDTRIREARTLLVELSRKLPD
jgi:hypothetical protein